MNLADTEIDEAHGGPIIRGQFSVGAEAALGIPEHDRVLLQFRHDGLAIWPVLKVEPGEHGFCQAQHAERGLLLRDLTLKNINEINLAPEEPRSLLRGGYRCGFIIGPINSSLWPLVKYEMQLRHIPEGVAMTLIARSAERQEAAGDSAGLAELGSLDIKIDATIPWQTLALAGFSAVAPHWKYEERQALPSKHDDPYRPRDPRRLQDLLIQKGLSGKPIVPGSLILVPSPDAGRFRKTPVRFVSPMFDTNQMQFYDAPGVEILDDGFARSRGLDSILTIRQFGAKWLIDGLLWENEISLSITGDGLGDIRHSGCNGHRRHGLLVLGQSIKTLALSARLGEAGLRLDIEGEMRNFDPVRIEANKRQNRGRPNSELRPVSTFTLHAVLPWALLRLRQFPFGRRAEDFPPTKS